MDAESFWIAEHVDRTEERKFSRAGATTGRRERRIGALSRSLSLFSFSWFSCALLLSSTSPLKSVKELFD